MRAIAQGSSGATQSTRRSASSAPSFSRIFSRARSSSSFSRLRSSTMRFSRSSSSCFAASASSLPALRVGKRECLGQRVCECVQMLRLQQSGLAPSSLSSSLPPYPAPLDHSRFRVSDT